MYPSLATLAAERPTESVRVIVQGNNPSGRLATTIEGLGGKIRKPLAIIKGIAVDMPAGKLKTLASDSDVRYISIDAPMVSTVGTASPAATSTLPADPSKEPKGSKPQTGNGIGVAVLDSGINDNGASRGQDFGNRVVAKANMARGSDHDGFGHGTYVAGVIASSGAGSDGGYTGAAPNADLVSVKVSDDEGVAYISDVIDGLQWVALNRARYNIRVANLSLVSSVAESYLTSPLDAAVEMLWLSGITVVVSAGNGGANTMMYPPANDPFVITVGAVDDNSTDELSDDVIPDWSSYGNTQDGFAKPEVVAPGRRIVSDLAQSNCVLAQQYPDRIVSKNYIRLSGTSVAAPGVSGMAALAFEAHPSWTPDQFKNALMASAHPVGTSGADGKGQVDAVAVVSTTSPAYANRSLQLNEGVAGATGLAVYDSATWNSATWNSATWNSATWNSATWNSATWNSATWNSATWNSATWNTRFPD